MTEAKHSAPQFALPDRAVNPETPSTFPPKLYLVKPNGFCAGIDRTIDAALMMESAFPNRRKVIVGSPAHNKSVEDARKENGWEQVADASLIPADSVVLFGPHGSTDDEIRRAKESGLTFVDTECPLVTIVKDGVRSSLRAGASVILWGKEGHAETRAHLGVSSQEFDEAAKERLLLGKSKEEILTDKFLVQVKDPDKVAFYAQTTHNADEAEEIRRALKERFPNLVSLRSDGVCYATRDRQFGVKEMAKLAKERNEKIIWAVIGDETSANSRHLFELATQDGTPGVFVLNSDMLRGRESIFLGYDAIAVTAGASAPKPDIDGLIEWFKGNGAEVQALQLGRDESEIKMKPAQIYSPSASN